jgi:hypothetical protein
MSLAEGFHNLKFFAKVGIRQCLRRGKDKKTRRVALSCLSSLEWSQLMAFVQIEIDPCRRKLPTL